MKTTIIYSALFAVFCFSIISCQKIDLRSEDKSLNSLNETALSSSINSSYNLVSASFIPHDDDSY